jgi:hypothetical protein
MLPVSKWLRLPACLFLRLEDERIYAVVRMAFAAAALLNLIFLWPDRQVFLSDSGLVDPVVAMDKATPVYLSVFRIAGGETAVTAVMLVTAFALVMLFAGIGARFAAFWVLVWHISYIARSPLPLAGWDLVLRSFSFLTLVSPLGKCWTLPALIRGSRQLIPANVPCYGLILMRLQVLVIYWQAVLARFFNPAPYWKNGEFLSYYLLSHHARWPGRWVTEFQAFLTLGTYAIQLTETAIPVLLLVRKTRRLGALLGIALHAGICVVTRDIGLFAIVMIMTYSAFLRKEDIEDLERWVKRLTRNSEKRSPGDELQPQPHALPPKHQSS